MALTFNSNHIVYYHMDTQHSIGLAQTYFASLHYLVVQCWVHSTFFHPDMIYPTEPNTYHYTKFFEGVVGYATLGFPCAQPMAVINYSDATMPFAVTAFPAL